MMDRRGFLRLVGVGLVAAPVLVRSAVKPTPKIEPVLDWGYLNALYDRLTAEGRMLGERVFYTLYRG